MFVVVVAMLLVLVLGVVMFTDLLDNGAKELRILLARLVQRARLH
ncbi:hypothetical protein [Saccharopolyspora taberi]|uniref:Uncharacterized protein n=1 Tax=Saccharopolyspora taberi TaxID=60895 RepID=A0ABN3VDL6_9PSEU